MFNACGASVIYTACLLNFFCKKTGNFYCKNRDCAKRIIFTQVFLIMKGSWALCWIITNVPMTKIHPGHIWWPWYEITIFIKLTHLPCLWNTDIAATISSLLWLQGKDSCASRRKLHLDLQVFRQWTWSQGSPDQADPPVLNPTCQDQWRTV